MVAPTESFTEIPNSDIDPDSPLTTGLMTSYRDNDLNLNSQLIGETSPFVAAQKHDHDGVNSALIALAGILNFSLFDLTLSGGIETDTDSTGALGFTPLALWVVGTGQANTGAEDLYFAGFATGTGASARAQSLDVSGVGFGVDADAIGGFISTAAATAFTRDIDVTAFGSGGITISFTNVAGVFAIDVKMMVFGV